MAPSCRRPAISSASTTQKTIEMRDFLTAIAGGGKAFPDFREAARIQAVIDAILTAARERAWDEVPA
jgi:predicted dehydrogenase